ncbi:MAG: DUF6597 domain-containing transcriptional factor, partial [Flavobacteriaceae bacterium]
MIFETHIPSSELGEHIETLIYFKDFMPDHSKERVIPTGHTFIIFELDGFKRNTYDNQSLTPNNEFTEVWVSGPHKNYLTISAHERSEMFVIQFKPYGAYPFFPTSMHQLSNSVVQANEIFGQDILDLRQQVLAAATVAEKFALATNWLDEKFNPGKKPPENLLKVLKVIEREKSTQNFVDLLSDYPFTRKHLINQFKK